MRNRQLVAAWVYEKGLPDNVIERRTRDGKTYFVVRDYDKLRVLFGDLLRELQRIKSEGDYEAIRALVEHYAVKVDPAMHAEVLERYAKLEHPPILGLHRPAARAGHERGANRGRANRVSRRLQRADARVRREVLVAADLELTVSE